MNLKRTSCFGTRKLLKMKRMMIIIKRRERLLMSLIVTLTKTSLSQMKQKRK
uniref:Uncharacterized protein n=1 Tax=Populus trichocarpa x Populus deltoides TaxID=3695 RepID=A9PJT6_9ROSI|nr:unknown [Populus trichocarpa x Populus deltoides]